MQQKFEPQALIQLEDPYQVLGTREALVNNLDALNTLNPKEMRDLVTSMVLTCPKEEWTQFGTQIYLDLSAESTTDSEDSAEQDETYQDFILSLNAAYCVKDCMMSLLNPSFSPYAVLQGILTIESAFNWENNYDAFNEYKPLVILLLGNDGLALAERLANLTPKSERSKIARRIELMFSDTIFPQQVRVAFEAKHAQEHQTTEDSTNNAENETDSEAAYETSSSEASEPASPRESSQQRGIEVDGILYKNVHVYSNGLFGQSELRQRKQSTDNNEPLPTKLSGSLLEELHEDEKSCCEKYCTLF